MADEQKEIVETPQNPPEKPESEEQEGEHIDYRTLYEDEKGRREKAESVIQRHKEKPKEDEEEQSSASLVDIDSIRSAIREEVDGLKSTFASQFRAKEIGDAISKVAADAHHTALIRYHYDNSIRQSGDLELDVENAKALADKRKVQSQLEEVKASIESKGARSSGSVSGRKPNAESDDETLPPLTPVDRQSIDVLRAKYVLSNSTIRRILKGERLDDLLEQGVIKRR